jgi:glyoxylase-like metal-dependent hydrolase (beta-lactamase superfamily II)/rhodanese-related sulfurtransferase
MDKEIIFYQMFESESSTYTYLIADRITKEAALIDPVLETVDRDLKLIEELGLRLMYVLDTHIHADHVTGAGEIRKRTHAKTGVSQKAQVDCVDLPLEDGQELHLGDKKIKVIATPGHTNTCLSFYFEGMVFTGDALLIRGTGRTDFQQGSSESLYHSIHEKLFKLPDDTKVYPGHDYRGQTSSTIELEKKFNSRIGGGKTKDEFKKTMSELKLANPQKIHEAVPANLACGKTNDERTLHPQVVDGIPEVTCEVVLRDMEQVRLGKLKLIDVRTPEEFNSELGHIQGTELVPLGPELTEFLKRGNRSEEIVFICRSGGRSGHATQESKNLGYKFMANMAGGMLRWNDLRQPVEKK